MQPSHNSQNIQMGRLFPIFDRIAVAAIGGYQRYLSPHKGFSCAHRVLYGDLSCSEYVKGQIQAVGVARGIVMARRRFAACREANQILQMRGGSPVKIESLANYRQRWSKRRWHRTSCQNSCNYVDCSGCCSDVDCGDCDLPGWDGFDCGDCGDCGGGIDFCSGADCGSCG